MIHSFSHQSSGSDLLVVEHLASVDTVDKKVYLSATSNQLPSLSLRHQGHVTPLGDNGYVFTYETRFDDQIQEILQFSVDRNLPLAHFLFSNHTRNPQVIDSIHINYH